MKIVGGGDNVTLRIWANGKTQTSGCKDNDMLLSANKCISAAIRQIYDMSTTHPNTPPIFRGGPDAVQEAVNRLGKVKILSAPILGSWDSNLKAVNAKLDIGQLCEYLSSEKFSDKVFKVTHVKPKGNSARFNNLSLYIRREALATWVEDHSEQTSVYVNVYEAGKCSVLAAPNVTVAEELVDVVSDMLYDAYQQDHIRIDVDTQQPPSKKSRH
mmetsp:Transcript_31608/g.49517  ORF Transcript_31608/g.49517 Transcript_31608/m.49517 type:complete len:214 (+) Transcript_31608:1641-2282(+)